MSKAAKFFLSRIIVMFFLTGCGDTRGRRSPLPENMAQESCAGFSYRNSCKAILHSCKAALHKGDEEEDTVLLDPVCGEKEDDEDDDPNEEDEEKIEPYNPFPDYMV